MWFGIVCVLLASFLFGSQFVPIRKVYAGDGFTSQLFVCLGAFFIGIIVHAAQGFPGFYGFAMIGGLLWALANAFSVQIMNRIGMGLGNLLWNSFSCLSGWATSRFGMFGLAKAVPASIGFNYIGIVILIIGALMYSLVKNTPQKQPGQDEAKENEEMTTLQNTGEEEKPKQEESSTVKDISLVERIISVIGAMASGLFYGTMWLPVNYMMSHPEKFPDTPTNPLHYLFSYTCGILSTAVCIFVIYAIVRRNRPWVSSNAIIPAFSTGLCYGCAMSAFVVAIDKLDAAIAYPIGQMAPGLVVSTWSLLYYREIMGRRNLLILACAYLLTVAGVIIVTISKEVKVF